MPDVEGKVAVVDEALAFPENKIFPDTLRQNRENPV